MGLDGFSINNLGLHKELTSAQLSNNSEVLAMKGTERTIKTVDELDSKQKTKSKEFEEEDEEPVYYFEEDEKSEYEDEDEDQENERNKNDDPKKYTVKLNNKTKLIELINLEKNTVIETISPNDLIKLVSKLNATSGILVNRKI